MLYDLVHNMILRNGLAFLTALVVSLIVGRWLIRFFHRKNVIEDTTQPDHPELNKIQSMKKDVPTMGGLMILAGIVVATLLFADLRAAQAWMGMLVLVVLGGAGFADDYIKLKRKPSRGLTKAQKLVVQILLGGAIGGLLVWKYSVSWAVPQFALSGPLKPLMMVGFLLYIPWCGFFMAATSNAVNLTDGLDGLAGGLVLIAALAMMWLKGGPDHYEILCASIAGGVAGFLWYNCHPAQIFMGDTGSLALGGLLAYAALAMKAEGFLLLAGAVFFIEELTVAMQIASFKLTKKRIFSITPIHHHFQVQLKWPEQKIVTRAWVIGILFAVLAMDLLRVF